MFLSGKKKGGKKHQNTYTYMHKERLYLILFSLCVSHTQDVTLPKVRCARVLRCALKPDKHGAEHGADGEGLHHRHLALEKHEHRDHDPHVVDTGEKGDRRRAGDVKSVRKVTLVSAARVENRVASEVERVCRRCEKHGEPDGCEERVEHSEREEQEEECCEKQSANLASHKGESNGVWNSAGQAHV